VSSCDRWSDSHDAYLSELTGLRDQLKASLSATGHDASMENGPTASELAESVKALKAANTVETAPKRVQRTQAAAEEPVTGVVQAHAVAGATSQTPLTDATAWAGASTSGDCIMGTAGNNNATDPTDTHNLVLLSGGAMPACILRFQFN
jgi:hypothetical protein